MITNVPLRDDPPLHGLVDLSCDLGEAATAIEQETERALWPLITSANVSCGGHAGDDESMHRAAVLARAHGVLLGAHPSYPDRERFGRQSMDIPDEKLLESLIDQIGRLRSIAIREGLGLSHVKPHGALYHDASTDHRIGSILIEALCAVDRSLDLVVPPRSILVDLAPAHEINIVAEAFADRRYDDDGSLVSRSIANSLLLDPKEAADQALLLVCRGAVLTRSGSVLPVPFRTLAVHGDMDAAVTRVVAIRTALAQRHVDLTAKARTGVKPPSVPSLPDRIALRTERLVLRDFSADDAAVVRRLINDPDIARNTLTIPYPYLAEDLQHWLAQQELRRKEGVEVVLALTTPEGTILGCVGMSVDRQHWSGELGYWIAREHRGNGYLPEAASALTGWAFESLGLVRIHACHFASNPASGRALEKIGMVREGIMRKAIRKWGAHEDIVRYSILREEWPRQ